MGTDLLNSFRTWENGDKLAEEINFIILDRPGYQAEMNIYPKKYQKLDIALEASSTKIRNRIAEHIENINKLNLGINGLTTNSVINYIIDNGLYATEKW